ncbi:Cytochrome c, mono-and diheme variants [Pseudarcicella hirudinis]|uniref:Cytochrome c, mono-and diheme variants n=1 Tax=Pseudarcicella hirudinis TaxID=1079859 RepID=A0A1I5VXN6_9BACT|nr:cytochrome c [Pseudarcicella hirudinis]SFQ12249.1 Cytochrome c, mono-and diheme variants [Pseudarcicella hirudinis]
MKYFPFLLALAALFSACDSKEDLKKKQYYVEGMELYKTHCANCHQNDGKGLVGLYPPLAGSDFMLKNKELVICAIRNGLSDTIVVNGKTYHQPMPPNSQLLALDIAEISTYIYKQWGNKEEITETKEVEKILEKCKKK